MTVFAGGLHVGECRELDGVPSLIEETVEDRVWAGTPLEFTRDYFGFEVLVKCLRGDVK